MTSLKMIIQNYVLGLILYHQSNTEHNNHNADYAALVTFTASNRDKYRKSTLSKERKALLDDIGFDWGPGSRQEQWDKMYAELKKFHEEVRHVVTV